MEKGLNACLSGFRSMNPTLLAYKTDRVALGANPGKVALGFFGEKIVCSIVFIDHLYCDGRKIYVPYFDKTFISNDGITARLDCHRFLESQMRDALSDDVTDEASWRFGCTDASPNHHLYWCARNEAVQVPYIEVQKDVVPISTQESPIKLTSKSIERQEVQLDMF